MGLALLFFSVVGTRIHAYHWDFNAYYSASMLLLKGLVPYQFDPRQILPPEATVVTGSYVYPPITFALVKPLSLIKYSQASVLWLISQLFVMIGLFYFWEKKFIPDLKKIWAGCVLLLGYNGALFWDVASGNVTLFEQAVLWIGFYGYISNRNFLFGACVVLVSLFKLTPIVLLILLLYRPNRQKISCLIASSLVFLGLIAYQMIFYSQPWAEFVNQASQRVTEFGTLSPSIYALMGDLSRTLSESGYKVLPSSLSFTIYALSSVSIFGVSFFWIIRFKPSLLETVYLVLTSYSLLLPRIKSYQFIQVLVPTIFVLGAVKNSKSFSKFSSWFVLILLLVCFPYGENPFPKPIQLTLQVATKYIPLFTLIGVWAFLLLLIRKSRLETRSGD